CPIKLARNDGLDCPAEAQRADEDGADQRTVAAIECQILRMAMFAIGQCIKRCAGIDDSGQEPRRGLTRLHARLVVLDHMLTRSGGTAMLRLALRTDLALAHDQGPLRALSHGPGLRLPPRGPAGASARGAAR